MRNKIVFRVVAIIAGLSLFDALIGGGIAAVMQANGWQQPINDVYQLGFAIVAVGLLAMIYFVWHWRKEALASLLLLAGLVEDTLFYVFIPAVNPIIAFLTGGYIYVPKGGGFFPETISGWPGWLMRMLGFENVSLPIIWVFVLNVVVIGIAYRIIKK